MRILHVLHTSLPYVCGYSIRSDQIITLQRKMGMEVAVATSAQQPLPSADETIAGVNYYRTLSPQLYRTPIRELQLMWALTHRLSVVIDKFKPDIVHAHSPVIVGIPAYIAARRHGLPLVYEVRDLWENASVDRGKFAIGSPAYRVARGLETWLLRRANTVVTIGDTLRMELMQRTSREIVVTPNGTDAVAFSPLTPESSWKNEWNPNGSDVIAYIGSFQPYEGLEILIKAMKIIVPRRSKTHLLIAGDGQERAGLEDLVRREGLSQHITFAGRVPHNRVREIYAIADLLVYPRIATLTTQLTTPLKPLEALSMQRAVLASNLPAMRELISNHETGILFEPGSAMDLAEKAIELLDDPSERSRLGKNGRSMVLHKRQWADSVSHYEAIYRKHTAASTSQR